MGLKLISAPASDPVSLAEAKAHLRIDFTDDDSAIALYLAAAVAAVDGPFGAIGRALIDQTWDFYLDAFPASHHSHYYHRDHRRHHGAIGAIEIPLPPLIEIQGVFYIDGAGVEQEFDAASYIVDDANEPARLTLANGANWPTAQHVANAVRIRFRAGYLDLSSPPVAAVPDAIKAAILLYLGALYSNRDQIVVSEGIRVALAMPWGAEQLLNPYNVFLGFA